MHVISLNFHSLQRGRTALHDAANSNYIELLKILLLNEAQMDLQDNVSSNNTLY